MPNHSRRNITLPKYSIFKELLLSFGKKKVSKACPERSRRENLFTASLTLAGLSKIEAASEAQRPEVYPELVEGRPASEALAEDAACHRR